MKIQHLAIIFVIIILPISMVLSYYLGSQIDTIKLQQTYDSKLFTATYDAIRGFQLNTINNKYSTISDSKIRDIEASITTFYNSLGTELGGTGYSEEDLRFFVPAILYTMYDGYYMYGEYYNDTLQSYQYGLKPYIYYSCRYINGSTDFVVNYTLDNTITIYGNIGSEGYVTKSGALINPKDVDPLSISTKTYNYIDSTYNDHTVDYADRIKYSDVVIEPEILTEQLIILDDNNNPSIDTYEYVMFNNKKVYVEKDANGSIARYNEGDLNYKNYQHKERDVNGNIVTYNGIKCFWNNKNKKQYISDIETQAFINAMTYVDATGSEHLHSNSACQYYYDAYNFSDWVEGHLDNITQNHAYEADGQTRIMDPNNKNNPFAIVTGSDKIFDFDDKYNNPTLESSIFNQNRICVIRRTIESNLSSAIANFRENTGYEFVMPVFTEDDWDKVVNNISIASFMQGIPIGTKYYNNYCIMTNDKNKELVTDDSIYLIDSNGEAHYAGCREIIDNNIDSIVHAYRNIDFERQTVVITEKDERYFYPHANQKSYNCMVNTAETYSIDDILSGEIKIFDAGENYQIKNIKTSNLRKVFLTALAREKYDLYRTNNYFND